jgi:aspartate kinase
MLEINEVVIAQGFIGSTLDGVTTTIGRGGSDHTGALLGAALHARDIQIWTDVSGILTADPRIVPAAHVVPEVTFTEARELAYFGAKVIHPDTILPAVARAIPVIIKNSMRPDDPGTRILPDGSPVAGGIHSITMKRGMTVLTLSPRQPFGSESVVEEALGLFARYSIPLQCAVVAESRAIAVIPSASFNDILLAALEASCHVELSENLAILCMTGASLRTTPGILSLPLAALTGIPISFVAAGSSDHMVLLGVAEEHATEALMALHRSLFEEEAIAVAAR